MTSDPNGLMVNLSLYKPWGESRGGAGMVLTDYGFNGQRSMEAAIGLYYFNARWFYISHYNDSWRLHKIRNCNILLLMDMAHYIHTAVLLV